MITQKVFTNELENRIDPHYYKPEFLRLISQMSKGGKKLKTLSEVSIKIASGATPLSGGSAYTNKANGIPFIRSGDINEDETIDFDNILYIKESVHNKKLKSSKLQKDDVLIAIVGATIGQVSVYKDDKEANINQAIALVRCNDEVNPRYVKAFLLSDAGQKQLERIKRPVARANINLEEVGSIKIPVIPLELQAEIVDIIQKAYLEKEKKLKQADELLNSIDDYVKQQLGIDYTEPEEEKIYIVNSQNIEENRHDPYYHNPKFAEAFTSLSRLKHKTYKLGQLMVNMSGGATPRLGTNVYSNKEDGIPFLRVQNITEKGILLDDVKYIKKEVHERELKRSQLKANDLVFTITGRIGSVAVVPNNFVGNINQHSVRIQLKNNIEGLEISPIYVATFLNSSFGKLITNRGITGGTRPALDYEYIKTIPIPIPDIETQNTIAKEFNKRVNLYGKLKTEASELLKQAKKQVEEMILN